SSDYAHHRHLHSFPTRRSSDLARTSHLRTLSKIFGHRPQRLVSVPKRFASGSRTFCHGPLASSTPREGLRPPSNPAPEGVSLKRAAHSSPFLVSVNTLFRGAAEPVGGPVCLRLRGPVLRGARILRHCRWLA